MENPKVEKASDIRARFENLAKINEAKGKQRVEEERRRRQAREQEEKQEEYRRSFHEIGENATSTNTEDPKGETGAEGTTQLPKGSAAEKARKFQAHFENFAKNADGNAKPKVGDNHRRYQSGKQGDMPASPKLASEPNTPTTPTFLQSPSEPTLHKKNLPQPFLGDPEEDPSAEFDESQTNQFPEEKTPTFLQSPPVPTSNKKNLPQAFTGTPPETETVFSFENTKEQLPDEQDYGKTKDEGFAKKSTNEPSKETNGLTAVALHNYEADQDDEISFVRGDAITNIEKIDENWCNGECKGQVGMFPANHVRMV